MATVVPCTMRSVCASMARRGMQHFGQTIEAGHHADRRVGGVDATFASVKPPVVHRDQVGEGAADIDADLQHQPARRR